MFSKDLVGTVLDTQSCCVHRVLQNVGKLALPQMVYEAVFLKVELAKPINIYIYIYIYIYIIIFLHSHRLRFASSQTKKKKSRCTEHREEAGKADANLTDLRYNLGNHPHTSHANNY